MTALREWWRKRAIPLLKKIAPLAPMLVMPMLVLGLTSLSEHTKPETLPISRLYSDVAADKVKDVSLLDQDHEATVTLKRGGSYLVVYPGDYGGDLVDRLGNSGVDARVVGQGFFEKYQILIVIGLIFLTLVAPLLYIIWKNNGLPRTKLGASLESSGLEIAPVRTPKERFTDVGGADEIIAEVTVSVDALRHPEKYRKFGVKPLTGFLLKGPPGTGKTLLARAIAGEAGVPLFATKGSDFMGRWLNDGPRAVREIFDQARKHGVAIIFIDEIDSIASKRSSNDDSGSKELNNTVNELLAQMDGFGDDSDATIVVIGATNRPLEDLDPGLLRPGRLTRHATMSTPDLSAREIILRLHARALARVIPDVDYLRLARITSGMTGAQLANLVNEAGLLALGEDTDEPMVAMHHFLEALDTAQLGVARKSRAVAERDREYIVTHEGGHTLVGMFMEGAARPRRVSIIARGGSGGHTGFEQGEEELLTLPELRARLAVLMGGRAAEKLVFGDDQYTTGAEDDIHRATELATYMITKAGMGGHYVAQIPLGSGHDPRTTEVAAEIDKLIVDAEVAAAAILEAHRTKLDELCAVLREKETIDEDELAAMFGVPAGA